MRNARAAKGGRLDDGFPLLDIKNILKSASEKVKFRKMTDKKDISEGIYGKKYRIQNLQCKNSKTLQDLIWFL